MRCMPFSSNVASMNRFDSAIAFTANVATTPHPTTAGVSQLWFPTQVHYNAGQTTPLCLTGTGPDCHGPSNWTGLVFASDTAYTQAINISHSHYLPIVPNPFSRSKPKRAPPVFAVRDFGKGRVAAMAQRCQYTVSSGAKWLFDSQILSTGAAGRRSDAGRLLRNTLQWLAQPVAGGPGGFADSNRTLVFPNDRPDNRKEFAEVPYKYDPRKLVGPPDPSAGCPQGLHTTRGIIGARTALSTGHGSVSDFAAAAAGAGLGFVVFTEVWSALNASALARLVSECARLSTNTLALIPGYTIGNNIGNKMMMFGPGVQAPPANALTPDGRRLYMQAVDNATGNFTGFNTPAFNWMLSAARSCRYASHFIRMLTRNAHQHVLPSLKNIPHSIANARTGLSIKA